MKVHVDIGRGLKECYVCPREGGGGQKQVKSCPRGY